MPKQTEELQYGALIFGIRGWYINRFSEYGLFFPSHDYVDGRSEYQQYRTYDYKDPKSNWMTPFESNEAVEVIKQYKTEIESGKLEVVFRMLNFDLEIGTYKHLRILSDRSGVKIPIRESKN